MSRADLRRAGMSSAGITVAVRQGAVIRLRRDRYCTPDADPLLQRAVHAGGRLTCVSELRRLGVWVAGDDLLHVGVAPNAARLPTEPGVRLHWEPERVRRRATPQHASPSDALETALGCLPRRLAVASLDSAMRMRLVTRSELAAIRTRVPAVQRDLIDLAEPLSESGLESIVRVLLLDLGFRVRSQVRFGGARVDLLVEEWVVVETDGDAYHDEKVTTRDRRRDARLARLGLVVLHYRYAQVMYELESVAEAVIASVAMHRRVPNSGKKAARARSRLRRVEFS